MSEVYNQQLFVRRSIIIELRRRVIDPHQRKKNRLISLVGAAGIGKSWVLADVYRDTVDSDEFIALWLDLAPEIKHPLTHETLPSCHDEEGRIAWLQRCVNDTNKQCGETIITLSGFGDFNNQFAEFSEAIASHNPRWYPILFVDGFDDIDDYELLDEWQERILATFWGHSSTQLLLARRDRQKLTHPMLIWSEEVLQLEGLTPAEQDRQIELRSQQTDTPAPNPDQMRTALHNYISPSPLLNTCLFKRAVKRIPPSIKTADVKQCLNAFMVRAGLDDRPIELVQRLANELPPEWKARALRDLRPPIRLEDDDMIALFRAGIVQQKPGTPFYQLDKGLYALL